MQSSMQAAGGCACPQGGLDGYQRRAGEQRQHPVKQDQYGKQLAQGAQEPAGHPGHASGALLVIQAAAVRM